MRRDEIVMPSDQVATSTECPKGGVHSFDPDPDFQCWRCWKCGETSDEMPDE